MRISSNSTPCATSQRAASRRSLACLCRVIASSGVPNRVPERVFTSQTTITCRSAATMSISPSAHRQLRSSTRSPARSRYSAATCSPSRPNSSLAFIGHHLHTDSARGGRAFAGRRRGLWMSWRDVGNCGKNRRNCPRRVLGCAGSCLAGPCLAGPCLAAPGRRGGAWQRLLGVGNLEVAPGEFLDVDVLERHDLDVLHESGGPVHVPHPGVLHGDLEEHVTVLGRADV